MNPADHENCDHVIGICNPPFEGSFPVKESQRLNYPLSPREDDVFAFCPYCGKALDYIPPTGEELRVFRENRMAEREAARSAGSTNALDGMQEKICADVEKRLAAQPTCLDLLKRTAKEG